MFPSSGAGYESGYGLPVFAFEFARSAEDLRLVFGSADDPHRLERIAAMVKGTVWDFGFLVLYGGFIFLFFLAVAKTSKRKTWLVFAVLGVLAAISDGAENIILLGLLDDLEAAKNLSFLHFPVLIKFSLLMVCGVGAGGYLMMANRRVWVVFGVLAIGGALVILPALVAPQNYGQYVSSGITLCWVFQLIYSVIAGFKSVTAT